MSRSCAECAEMDRHLGLRVVDNEESGYYYVPPIALGICCWIIESLRAH